MSPRMGGYVPADHKTRHQDGGRDEVSIADLAGESVNLAAHKLVLDAHTRNNFETLRTGEYILPLSASGMGGATITVNILYATLFNVPRAMTVDRVGIQVNTGGAAGKLARLGIYKADGANLYPGTLVVDGGAVLIDATGIRAVTISQALTKGLHYCVFVSDGTPIVQYVRVNSSPLGINTNFTFFYGGWNVAFTYAALPDPFTAGGSKNAGVFMTLPRLLSLD